MYRYDKLFSEYGHTVAQVLVTGEDARDEARSANIEATLNRLLALGALPIVNENDTVSTAEIAVGDNDTLGAIVAVHLRADLLVLLTDIDGLYTADPHTDAAARRIERVEEVTDAVLALGGGAGSAQGTGGMATKLSAARLATQHGVEMVIANGKKPELLYDILEGKPVGTRFSAQKGGRA